jgi:hypothetical protein
VPALQSVPTEILAAAAARNADTVTSGCLANAMNGNPRADAPAGAQLVVRPESLPLPQLRLWTEGGFSGTGDSYPRLLWLLQELCWLDGVARRLAYDQAWADAFVRHSIVTVRMTATADGYHFALFMLFCGLVRRPLPRKLQPCFHNGLDF